MKRSIMLIIIVTLLSIISNNNIVKAATNDSFSNGEYIYGMYFRKDKDGISRYETPRFIIRNSDGMFTYCLDPFKEFAENNVQTANDNNYEKITNLTSEQWNRVMLLAYYGYKYENHDDYKWYVVTQFMIWQTVEPNSDIYFSYTPTGKRITVFQDEMEEMETLIANHNKKPSFHDTNQTMSLNSTITLEDKNNIISQYEIINNQDLIAQISDNKLNVSSNKLGTTTLKLVKNDSRYNTSPVVYTDPVSQNLLVVGSYEPIVISININTVGGQIRLTKIDSETNTSFSQGEASLTGSVYNVFDSNNNIVDILIIDDNKMAITKYLPLGNYKIREFSNSKGYYLDATTYNINITSSSTIDFIVKGNVIKSRIKITRLDKENNSCISQGEANLIGSEYGIYDNKNNLVDKVIINENCEAITKLLPYGNYKIKEINSSLGYKKDTNIYTANITNDKIINITSKVDVIKGNIKITRLDKENNSCISQGEASLIGSEYGIYDNKNNLVDKVIINENCEATTKLLPYGNYKIKEIKNSTGYYLDTNIYSEHILKEELYEVIVLGNVIKNAFTFYKFYGNEGTGFIYSESNALFEVYNNNIFVLSFVTDKNGQAEITLPYGNYIVKQKTGLEDYKLIYPFNINVTEHTDNKQINYIKNGPISARLKLINIDSENGKNIIGSKFKIKDKKTKQYICQVTNKLICEYETNEDGILITPLPLLEGTYIIEQIISSKGYLLSKEQIEFNIKDNSQIIEDSIYGSMIEIIYENKPAKGKLEIIVKDKITQTSLINVRLEIYLEDNTLIGSYITDKNGKIFIDNLPINKDMFIIEKEVPDNYKLNKNKRKFKIEIDKQIIKINIEKTEIKQNLELEEENKKPTEEDKQFKEELVQNPNIEHNNTDEDNFKDIEILDNDYELIEVPDTGIKQNNVVGIFGMIIIMIGRYIEKYEKTI